MFFRTPLYAQRNCLAAILAWSLLVLPLSSAAALDEPEPNFKMVDLTPSTMLVTSQAPDRDPFNWPTTQRVRLRQIADAELDIFADFILQAIVWSKTTPQAVINSQLVTIGDMVDGALITDISQTKVSLSKNSRKHSMQFDTYDIDFGSQPPAKGNVDDTK